MKEDMRFTVEWSQRRHVLRCSAIIPEEGLPWNTFLWSIDQDCQYAARRLVKTGMLIVKDGIVTPNPVVKWNVHLTFDELVQFLSGPFAELEDAVERYQSPIVMTVEEKLEELFAWRKDFFDIEPNEIIQKQLAETDALFRRIRPHQITDEQAEQIKRIHSDLYYIHYRMFGNEKEKSAQEFHATKGKYLTTFLEHAMMEVVFTEQALANIYHLLGDYYELVGMWAEAVTFGEKLLRLYESQGDEENRCWLIHIILSERYLMRFRDDPDYEKKSMYHMEMAQKRWTEPEEEKKADLKLVCTNKNTHMSND